MALKSILVKIFLLDLSLKIRQTLFTIFFKLKQLNYHNFHYKPQNGFLKQSSDCMNRRHAGVKGHSFIHSAPQF